MKPTDAGTDATLTPDQAKALSETSTIVGTPRGDEPPPQPKASSETSTIVGAPRGEPPELPVSAWRDRLSELQLGDVLGRGGMGEVVLAQDHRIGRAVALKRMHAGPQHAAAISRFLREAKIQARLEHPAIVPVHDLGIDPQGLPYFTMKRLAGTTFGEVIYGGAATLRELLRTLVDVCQAVEFAHSRGVIHRDLKPSNIMLGEYGAVYVLDWGLARVIGDHEVGAPRDINTLDSDGHTQAGAVLGTPGYMAPEQARGEEAGPAADVYALGSILFEILAGEPVHPRGAAALPSTLDNTDPHSPARRRVDREIAPELDAACTGALAFELAERPTAGALATQIQRYLDGDRDLERRRSLAGEQLALARAAVDSGDPARRAEAMQAAGRALALDPESDAAALVAKLVIEPPAELPAALSSRLADNEQRSGRLQSAIAVRTLLAYLAIAPFVLWNGVTDWALLAITVALLAIAIAMSAVIARTPRRAPILISLAVNAAFLVVMNRYFGSFVFVPGVLATTAIAFAMFPSLLDRPWLVTAAFGATFLLPLGLEALGVWSSTWSVGDHAMVFRSAALELSTTPTAVFLIVGNLVLVCITPLFVHQLAKTQHRMQRQLAIQAWHLEQLLPRRA